MSVKEKEKQRGQRKPLAHLGCGPLESACSPVLVVFSPRALLHRPRPNRAASPPNPPRRRRGVGIRTPTPRPLGLPSHSPPRSPSAPAPLPLLSRSISPSFPTATERRHGLAAVNRAAIVAAHRACVSVDASIVFLVHRRPQLERGSPESPDPLRPHLRLPRSSPTLATPLCCY